MRILREKEHPASRALMMSKLLPVIRPFARAAEVHPEIKSVWREKGIDNEVLTSFL